MTFIREPQLTASDYFWTPRWISLPTPGVVSQSITHSKLSFQIWIDCWFGDGHLNKRHPRSRGKLEAARGLLSTPSNFPASGRPRRKVTPTRRSIDVNTTLTSCTSGIYRSVFNCDSCGSALRTENSSFCRPETCLCRRADVSPVCGNETTVRWFFDLRLFSSRLYVRPMSVRRIAQLR